MQTSLCSKCKCNNITIRCGKEHLENFHALKIDDTLEIIDKMTDLINSQRARKQKQHASTPLKRKDLVEYAESLILPNIDKLKQFLNSNL